MAGSKEFPGGITNGAQWYPVYSGMQVGWVDGWACVCLWARSRCRVIECVCVAMRRVLPCALTNQRPNPPCLTNQTNNNN